MPIHVKDQVSGIEVIREWSHYLDPDGCPKAGKYFAKLDPQKQETLHADLDRESFKISDKLTRSPQLKTISIDTPDTTTETNNTTIATNKQLFDMLKMQGDMVRMLLADRKPPTIVDTKAELNPLAVEATKWADKAARDATVIFNREHSRPILMKFLQRLEAGIKASYLQTEAQKHAYLSHHLGPKAKTWMDNVLSKEPEFHLTIRSNCCNCIIFRKTKSAKQ